jgi:hypothetical protein
MLIYFKAIWNNSWILGIFYDHSLHFVFLVHFYSFGITRKEKSGNPDPNIPSCHLREKKLSSSRTVSASSNISKASEATSCSD